MKVTYAGVAALAVPLCATACGSSAHVASNFPLAIHRLATAKSGVVTTSVAFNEGGESIPPIVYVTKFDNVRRRVETNIDFRKFIRVYNVNVAPADRVGTPDEWRLDVITDSSHGLIVYMSSRLFSDATFQRKLPQRLRHRKWLKLSLPELAPKAATLGPALTAEFAQLLPGFGSPVSYFRALGKRASIGKVDNIDGVEARGYSEKVDFRPYLDVLPRLVREIIARSSSRMDALIWVDGTSNVRRILLTSAPIRGANGAQMSDTTDVGQLGGRVTIRIPPRGEVLDTLSLPKT